MWPGKSVLIIIHVLVSLVYSLPPNIDWSNLQYDPNLVAQNENILKLFLQLAMHTANRLMYLKNETDRNHDCKGRNNIPVSLITEAPITQSLLKTNLERPDKSRDRIQNRLFINDSEINNNDRVLLENLNQDQTTLLYSTQSQELSDNSSNFQEVTDVAHDSKTSNLLPTLENQNTSSDVFRRNYDNLDTSQKLNISNTISNVSKENEFNSDVQNSQNLTLDDISERSFNTIDLMKNISNTTVMSDSIETVHKFFPTSQNVQEPTPEVSQRLFDIDLAKNIPDTKIVNNLYENVNRFNTRRSQNTREQSGRNNENSKSSKYRDSTTTIKNFENFLNPQIMNNLTAMNQILSNTKNFVESIIKALPETESAESEESGNNFLNHIISQSRNVNAKIISKNPANFNYIQHHQIRNVEQVADEFDNNLIRNHQNFNENSRNDVNKPSDTSKENNQNTEYNNLSINTYNSKTENSHSQSASINDRLSSVGNDRDINEIDDVMKPEVFEKTKMRTNYTNEQLNPISETLSQRNETNEFSITKYEGKDSSSAQNSENVNKSNVEKPKERQDNSSTNIRISRSIENRNTPIDNNVLKSNNCSCFVDNLKYTNLLRQLSKTRLNINDRLIDASELIKEEKIPNSESHMTDDYNMISRQQNKNLPLSNIISNSKLN